MLDFCPPSAPQSRGRRVCRSGVSRIHRTDPDSGSESEDHPPVLNFVVRTIWWSPRIVCRVPWAGFTPRLEHCCCNYCCQCRCAAQLLLPLTEWIPGDRACQTAFFSAASMWWILAMRQQTFPHGRPSDGHYTCPPRRGASGRRRQQWIPSRQRLFRTRGYLGMLGMPPWPHPATTHSIQCCGKVLFQSFSGYVYPFLVMVSGHQPRSLEFAPQYHNNVIYFHCYFFLK